MKVNLEKIEKNIRELEIEVAGEEVAKALRQAYLKTVKKVNIPGFRKGKVPKAVLENFIGKEVLLEEAAEIMLSANYEAAVVETGIEPIDKANVEIIQLEEEKPFIFKAKVAVKPEVTLGEYKGISVEKPDFSVTEDDVTKEVEKLQQRYAKLIELGEEEEIKEGDIASISFQGFVDGEPFEGGSSENHSLGIGSGSFIPGFEEQLIGAKINEKRDVQVTFPENYQKEDLAGQEALFKVEIKGAKRKELSPIDDEFAKDVSEFDSLEELRADLNQKLVESAKEKEKAQIRSDILTKVVDGAAVEIPSIMVDQRVEQMMAQFEDRLGMQGLSMEQYCKFAGADQEQLRVQYRLPAEKDVKTDLVLETVAKVENITATDEDLDEELSKISKQYQQPVEKVKEAFLASGYLASISREVVLNKTVDFLVSAGEIA